MGIAIKSGHTASFVDPLMDLPEWGFKRYCTISRKLIEYSAG